MRLRNVDVITLGCSKNLVDSERLMKLLDSSGFNVRHNPEGEPGNVVIINTCGFIGDAKEESINTILSYVPFKEEGRIDKLIVMGCLSERYGEQLKIEIPEVDHWFGKFDWSGIVKLLSRTYPAIAGYERIITSGRHSAYLKISEGCNRFCAFCAIPLITGRHKSRPIDEIVEEVRHLSAKGVKELNVIAQDLSSYGLDLYGCHMLAELIDKISEVEGVEWIRLHYAYPADFPYDVLPIIRDNPKVCKYLDIALQHISDPVLKNMRRRISSKETRELIKTIRATVPGIHLRTTLMVGFPGEGEAEFDELMGFVKEIKFERMGAFAYCEEDDTYAAVNYNDSIEQSVKDERLDKLMNLQEDISLCLQEEKVGRCFKVLIDREDDDYYIGRTEYDSPEVDPEVLIEKSEKLKVGTFCYVEIIQALPFELIGKICSPKTAK